MSEVQGDEQGSYDLLGVGFGPSNLALAIAVSEHNATGARPLRARFLERQDCFGWHRGMLIDDATMQVSFLKDLVTLRNPASDFSFVSYLHQVGRLVDFVNHKTLFPLRVEFHDYFRWAADRLGGMVSYGSDVVRIRPVSENGEVVRFEVRTRCGEVYSARNLVVATGLEPSLPDGITTSERVWHNSDLLRRVDELGEAGRLVVVGAGQSAAETTAMLHERFSGAEVCSVFSRFGYSPSDDSPFANRIFDPDAVDEFFTASPEVRDRIMGYHANTNYSVVDLELIEDLYRRYYRERVLGAERLRFLHASSVSELKETDDTVRVVVRSLTTGELTVLDADAVVFATGYRPGDPTALLGELADSCVLDDDGRPVIGRDYRVATTPNVRGGVYVQGGVTERTHGITSSLLSNNALRARDILDSLLAQPPLPEGAGAAGRQGDGPAVHETVGAAVGGASGPDGGLRDHLC